jgi:transposase
LGLLQLALELRALSRQHEMLMRCQSQHVQHMQKALTQMNVQLDNVISNIAGDSGQRIIRAILSGERDPAEAARV